MYDHFIKLKKAPKEKTKSAEIENIEHQDPVGRLLQERQKRLHKMGNSEALVREARAKLLQEAKAEFAALMYELNKSNE